MDLKAYRRTKGIKIKDVPMDRRTVSRIEADDDSVSLKSFKIYLKSIGLTMLLIDEQQIIR